MVCPQVCLLGTLTSHLVHTRDALEMKHKLIYRKSSLVLLHKLASVFVALAFKSCHWLLNMNTAVNVPLLISTLAPPLIFNTAMVDGPGALTVAEADRPRF